MSGSIVSALSRFLTPDLISKMASVAGISDAARARNAVAAAAAAILSGMANLASKPGGAQALADAIAQQPPHMLDTLSSAAGALGQLADVGQDVLASLFGRGPFSSLTRAIGKYAGLGNGPVNSVLGMLTPAILGVLGREARVGPTALKQLLSAQKDQIAAAMPNGLVDDLRTSGFFGQTGSVASMAGLVNDTHQATTERVDTVARAMGAPTSRSMHWAYWAVPLAALAGLLWYLLSGERTNPPGAPTAAATAPATPGGSTDGDVERRMASVMDALGVSLQSVRDKSSATDALPKLQEVRGELEGLSGLASRLPVEARSRLAETIKTANARLKSALDMADSLPGTPADVKATIAGLQSRLDGLVRLAQQTSPSLDGRVAYVTTAAKGSASVRTYFDRDVYNNAGEKIGVIKDLVVGPDGRIVAAVIGVGGFLGIGEKDVAVTFPSIRITQRDDDRRLVADATKDALRDAPIYRETNPEIRPSGANTQK